MILGTSNQYMVNFLKLILSPYISYSTINVIIETKSHFIGEFCDGKLALLGL